MIIVKPEGSPACCRSEREFLRAIHDAPGVFIANANVPSSTAPGAFTREVDGVMLTPWGICTVEVKGIRATGELSTPRMDAWSVNDGETKVPLMGRPHAQALAHSKYLASFLKDTGVAPGWIQAVLAIVGDEVRLPEDAEVLVVDNVHVVLSKPGVSEVLRAQAPSLGGAQELSVEFVQEVLTTFECVDSAPTREDLLAQGFRTQATIAAEIEQRRAQVRQEFLSLGPSQDPAAQDVQAGAAPRLDVSVNDAPSTTEWAITAQRYAEAVAVDAELTETGAFVDGVPMHRRLVSYAERKGVRLSDVAAVVNDPVEVLGDAQDATVVHCGADFAVSVRTMDGLAMFYKPLEAAKAERLGAVVGGVEISARAAKQALNQFNVSLEAITRIVTAPQERWWVPGTTDVAHARGEFVAVTAGHLGPVLYVQNRAVAVARAVPKPIEEKAGVPPFEDVTVEGITLRASAVRWCHRRNVALEALFGVATAPEETWAGHSPNMEVRCGETTAVLLDVETQTVVAVMTLAEAIEYRDGVVRDGVRLTGQCVFLARRRKASIEDILAAYTQPLLIARAPGAHQSVYVGAELAVTVSDETRAVDDFTFAGHARSLIRRGELVPVDLPSPAATGSGAPEIAPLVGSSGKRSVVSSPAVPSPALLGNRRAQREGAGAAADQGPGEPGRVAGQDTNRVEVMGAKRGSARPSPLLLDTRTRHSA